MSRYVSKCLKSCQLSVSTVTLAILEFWRGSHMSRYVSKCLKSCQLSVSTVTLAILEFWRGCHMSRSYTVICSWIAITYIIILFQLSNIPNFNMDYLGK